MIDQEEIVRALKLWFQPGDVFEVRVLKAVTPGYLKPHTESGYFDYDNIPAAADALEKLRAYAGAYVTVNPVSPDLLARACNRLCPAESESTTADSDIVCRRWLLVDCDAVRKAKISSTGAEHEAALAKALEIRDGLSSLGWPMPIMLDSGNGAQMTYRIDLPADDGGLVQKVIAEIAKASSDAVKVDLTVYNPARIWRIPGTMNRKGDNIPVRPHRMARILEVPDKIVPVTEEQLLSLVGAMDTPSVQQEQITPAYMESSGFSIDEWIAKYAPDAGPPRSYKGGRKWIFNVCPFNPDHDNKSAALTETPEGAIGFRCLHDHCAGNDWRKFRVMREPGCYDRKGDENLPPVDIGGIMNQFGKPKAQSLQTDAADTPKEMKAEIPFPEELFNVPGFISDVMAFDLGTAPCPNPALAFAGALALQAHLAARKIEAPGGARTNPYIIMLAKSGYGKDHPRKINKVILQAVGLGKEVIENVGSGQGLEDRLLASPAILWQSDEFYAVLQEVANDKTGQKETLMKNLLSYFTSAAMSMETRAKSGRDPATIQCPNLTLLACCTPGGFFDSLTDPLLRHGMYSRMNLFHASVRADPVLPGDFTRVPEHIKRRAKRWADYRPHGSGNMDIQARMLSVSPAVKEVMSEILKNIQAEYKRIDRDDGDDWKLAVWTRAFESVIRYALIYSCSIADTPESVEFTVDALRWAAKLVRWEAANKIAMTEKHYYQSDFERASEYVIDILTVWRKAFPDKPMPGWKFNRRTKKFPPNILKAVLESLEAQERIAIDPVDNGGKRGSAYSLRQ